MNMNMSEDFEPAMPVASPSKKSSKNLGKQLVEKSDFAVGELFVGFMWAMVKQPGKTILGVFGIIGAVGSIGPFIMGFGGFEVAPNAPMTEKLANTASLHIARPVANGALYAVTEASLRKQNQYINPQNTGTLTPTQVKALQRQMQNSRATFVSYRAKGK
jgi:hypothetical protein